MLSEIELSPLLDFLSCETPECWVEKALEEQSLLLIDHANCEKKAAGTALNLMFRYVDKSALLKKMSQLAREELLHFEKVLEIMEARHINYVHLKAGCYAESLRRHIRKNEPDRLVDLLILGGIIEARSCERFAKLAPHLDPVLKKFYLSLLKSEARHFEDYISLAREYAQGAIDGRIEFLIAQEGLLINAPDDNFRFHSGVPL